MDNSFDCENGYCRWGNVAEVVHMKKIDDESKKLMLKNYHKKILRDILNGRNGVLINLVA